MLRNFGLAIAQGIADLGTPPALPHDRLIDRPSTAPLPHHKRLALIGDADSRDRGCGHLRRRNSFLGERDDRPVDLFRVMLDPSGLRIELPYLGISASANPPARIDDENRRAGGSLVDRKYHLRHREISP